MKLSIRWRVIILFWNLNLMQPFRKIPLKILKIFKIFPEKKLFLLLMENQFNPMLFYLNLKKNMPII